MISPETATLARALNSMFGWDYNLCIEYANQLMYEMDKQGVVLVQKDAA